MRSDTECKDRYYVYNVITSAINIAVHKILVNLNYAIKSSQIMLSHKGNTIARACLISLENATVSNDLTVR